MFPKIKLIQIARQYLQYYYYKYVAGTEDNVHKNFSLIVFFIIFSFVLYFICSF